MPTNNPNQANLEALADRLDELQQFYESVGIGYSDTEVISNASDLRLAARCVRAWAKVAFSGSHWSFQPDGFGDIGLLSVVKHGLDCPISAVESAE